MTARFARFGSGVFAIVVTALSSGAVWAEYRAYRHQISGEKGSFTVVSTLDPTQYANQHLAGQWDSVILEQSWMCYGRTSDFVAICPPPPDEGGDSPPPPTSPD